MSVALIVAMDRNNGIGKNNDLMWHLPADMKFFKESTSGQIVIMGRKNYESIPESYRPLPNRLNIVITRQENVQYDGCEVYNDLNLCIEDYRSDDRKTFVIGGGEIYKLALELDLIDEMLITHVHADYDADTFFPTIDESSWNIQKIAQHQKDEKNEASFTIKRYLKK